MNNSTTRFHRFLDESGLNKYYLGENSLDTRLYHDLKIYGDIAESYIELLHEKFDVDVSNFSFSDYFPEEFLGDSFAERILFLMIPFRRQKADNAVGYKPFTFRKLKVALEDGCLV